MNQVFQSSPDFSHQMGQMMSQFDKACRQISRLNQEIIDLRVRCERSHQDGSTNFLYQQQIRQLILQGLLGIYQHYVNEKAASIATIGREAWHRERVTRLGWIGEQNVASSSRVRTEDFIADADEFMGGESS